MPRGKELMKSGWMALDVKCIVKDKSTGELVEEFTAYKTDDAIRRCKATYGENYFETYDSLISVLR